MRGKISTGKARGDDSITIDLARGGQITLDKSQVLSVTKQNQAETEYDRVRAEYSTSAADQWALAEWCRKNKLTKQRVAHLEKVIAADPNHAPARRALGYSQIKGSWVLPAEVMTDNGLVRYKGAWRYPQEVKLMKERAQQAMAQKEWMKKLKRWDGWLDGDRASAAAANIEAIDDPAAVPAVAAQLRNASSRQSKMLYVKVLTQIGTPSALGVLIDCSMEDDDEEVRIACLERLSEKRYATAITRYIRGLKSKDNQTINQAAVGLAYMNDASAVAPLIDALVTIHRYRVGKSDPGQMSTTFSNAPGGGGFSFGGGEKVVDARVHNRAVLDALVQLTGQNYEFNVAAWKDWYAAGKRARALDARRD